MAKEDRQPLLHHHFKVKQIFFNFEDRANNFLENGDPDQFSAAEQIQTIRNSIASPADFSDIRFLSQNLKSDTNDTARPSPWHSTQPRFLIF
jgi:hypothetical protein